MEKNTTGLSRDLIIHPGETLNDIIEQRGINQSELAKRTGFSTKHISSVLSGSDNISTKFAKSLEYALGIDMMFWINLQNIYNQEILEYEESNQISDEEISIYKKLKDIVSYFSKIGIIDKCLNNTPYMIIQLRKALQVSNLTSIPKMIRNSAFRVSTSTNIDVYVLFAWKRLCELKSQEKEINNPFDAEKLKRSIDDIKKVMFLPASQIEKKLSELFANCGITFSIVKHFKGAPVQGLISKSNDGHINLCMTIRMAFSDIFWFTLFHEIAHILNEDFHDQPIDYDFGKDDAEKQADLFASNVLINDQDYQDFLKTKDFSIEHITHFAKSQKVKPYIVIGRLQKEKILDYAIYSNYKERYSWAE